MIQLKCEGGGALLRVPDDKGGRMTVRFLPWGLFAATMFAIGGHGAAAPGARKSTHAATGAGRAPASQPVGKTDPADQEPPTTRAQGRGTRRTLMERLIYKLYAAWIRRHGPPLLKWAIEVLDEPPPKVVKALYKLPGGKTVLVFVDDFRRPVAHRPIKQELTERLNRQILAHRLAAKTIPHKQLADLARSAKDFGRMPIPAIGRKLGAELVVYIDIRKFSLKGKGAETLWRGRLEVSVKVVDSKTGLLWPADRPGGCPLAYSDLRPSEGRAETHKAVVLKRVAQRMAEKIARLFRDHPIPIPAVPKE